MILQNGNTIWLTTKDLRSRHAGGRVRAHETVHIHVVLSEHVQEARCQPTLSVAAVDYQLRDQAHGLGLDRPTTGEYVAGQMAVDNDSDVQACRIIG